MAQQSGVRLFSMGGFEVKLDPSWFILAVLVTWTLARGYFPAVFEGLSVPAYWALGAGGALGLFISIVLHEYAHASVGRRFGVNMKGITLFIFGGRAELENERPPSPSAEFSIAIAGPIASVFIAVFLYFTAMALQSVNTHESVVGLLSYLAGLNLILAIFNMIPAYPMDGGRVLRAILWKIKGTNGLEWSTRIASGCGKAFALVLLGLGFISLVSGNFIGGIWLGLISMFIFSAATMSYKQLVLHDALEGEPVSHLMSQNPITVNSGTPVRAFLDDWVARYHHKMYPVVDSSGKAIGTVDIEKIKNLTDNDLLLMTVDQVMESISPEIVLEPHEDAFKALSKMNDKQTGRMMVVERERVVGIVTFRDLRRFMSTRKDLGRLRGRHV